MKKLLRFIPALALAAALLTVTALACSPDDSNPEHHENVIQTDEEKPTCLHGGYYVLECTVCGMRCTYQTDPALPHSYGPWQVVPGKEPTCTKAGEKQAYCSMCNKWYVMPAPATGHSWYKYYTKEPTCTTAGEYYTYCRNCPASQGRSTEPATGHFWVVWKRVFATCTTPGYTEFVCDDCGATVSLTLTWDAGTNGGTIDGKTSVTTTGKPNATATAPTSTPVKAGHAFKGWYTSASGGTLYNTVTITAAKTFYAQFTANSYSITWDLGDGNTEVTKQTYGEKLVLPTEPTRKNAEFHGWFTEKDGGTEVTTNDVFTDTSDVTYYAHWEITEVFSVTVPVVLPLTVDENGEVHTGAAEIINASTGAVVVSSVSISTKNGWQLVPFATDMAHEKVDAKLLGFKINDSETKNNGDAETFTLSSPWQIAENGRLPISYDAVVSAVSQPVTEQDVLSVVFVLEWKEE